MIKVIKEIGIPIAIIVFSIIFIIYISINNPQKDYYSKYKLKIDSLNKIIDNYYNKYDIIEKKNMILLDSIKYKDSIIAQNIIKNKLLNKKLEDIYDKIDNNTDDYNNELFHQLFSNSNK